MIQNSATLPPLPHIDISSPEAARESLPDYMRWLDREYLAFGGRTNEPHYGYVRCCIDAMRFEAAHKSEAMKQAAQEAIEKLKAMLADSGR